MSHGVESNGVPLQRTRGVTARPAKAPAREPTPARLGA